MPMLGMDIDQVRQFAQQLEQSSTQIKDMVGQLTAKLDGAQWTGPDHDKFHEAWTSNHVVQLNNVSTALHDASVAADNNAKQQEDASNA